MDPGKDPVRTTIRFPPDVHEALARLAKEHGIAVQFSVVQAVRAYLAQPEIKAKLKKRRGA